MKMNVHIVGIVNIPIPYYYNTLLMDLNTLRTLYSIGNYSAISHSSSESGSSPESIALTFKSLLLSSANGDIAKCTQFISVQLGVSDLLKRTLLLWAKATLKPANHNDVMAFQELAVKAHEAAEIDSEEREQVILTSAEALAKMKALPEAFSLLKLVKASNIGCQVLFIEILIKLGQIKMAQERLDKMEGIPEWKDDVRFLLIEALLGLHNRIDLESDTDTDAHNLESTSSSSSNFSVKDSLYSYQELIQVHGQTPLLLLHLAASYALLSKFGEAQSTLLQISSLSSSCDSSINSLINSNLIALSALLNSSSEQLK